MSTFNAYKCDRCGKISNADNESEKGHELTVQRRPVTQDIPKKFDLCFDCSKLFNEWMDNKPPTTYKG